MSASKTLLSAIKKSVPKFQFPLNPDRRIANQISRSLIDSQTFVDHTHFPQKSLNPKIVHLVLSNTNIPPQSCLSFFSSLQSLNNFDIIEPYISLSFRLYISKDFDLANEILNQLAINKDIQNPIEKIRSFFDEKNGFLNEVVVVKMFNTLFCVYADNFRFNESLEVFDYMKCNGFSKIDDQSCMVFLRAAERYQKFELLSDFFRKMLDSGVKITVCSMTMAVSALCKLGENSKARELIYEMIIKGVKPSVYTYNALMYSHLKNSEFSEVEMTLDLMKKEGVSYSVATYTLLIELYSRLGNIEKADKVFVEMLESGIVPDVYAYNTMIRCTCKLGTLKRAFELFDELVERGVVPNVHTYGVLINGLCESGEMKDAEDLLIKMQSKGIEVDDFIVNTLIYGYCKKENVDDAINLMSLMENKGFEPSVVSYNIIANGLCQANRHGEAKILLLTMVEKGVAPNMLSYTMLIHIFCKQGDLEEAKRTLIEMESEGMKANAVTYNALMDAHCEKGLISEAYKIRDEMQEKGVMPNVYTYTCLGHWALYHPRAPLIRVQPKLQSILDRNDVSYTTLICGLCKEGRMDEGGFKLFDEMKSEGGISPDDNLYSSLVETIHSVNKG